MKRILLGLLIALTTVSCAGRPRPQEPRGQDLETLSSSQRRRIAKTAEIQGIWYNPDKREYEHGVTLKLSFQIKNAYQQRCTLVAWFYDKNRKPLQDKNGEYSSQDKNVATTQDFTPAFHYAKYTKYGMFIPWNEFHLAPGRHDLTFKVGIYWRSDSGSWNHIMTSGFYKLPVNWKIRETGEVTKLAVDYNKEKDGKNGIQITMNYSAHAMKGRKGRFVFEFYYDLRNLSLLYEKGNEKNMMTYEQPFNPKWDHSDFTNGWYWLPYDIFPLKVGKNTFYFKVWLQVFGDDGNWYTLDATTAKKFYVNNGTIDLPEVWVVKEWRVVTDWDLDRGQKALIRQFLVEFNRRLYDATDGQVRIAKFVIERATADHDHFDPVIRIYKDYQKGDHGRISAAAKGWVKQMRPFANLGTPSRPGDIHLSFEKLEDYGAARYSCALVHEFHHAAFGLNDEYTSVKDPRTGATYGQSLCASTEILRTAWNTCIMGAWSPRHRELCKPDTHADHDKLNKVDCYSRVQRALKTSLGLNLKIPDTPVEGPHNPREPNFHWK